MSKNIEINICTNENSSTYEVLYPKVDLGNVTNISTLANNLKSYFHSGYIEIKSYTGTGSGKVTVNFTDMSAYNLKIIGIYSFPQYLWTGFISSSGTKSHYYYVPQMFTALEKGINYQRTANYAQLQQNSGSLENSQGYTPFYIKDENDRVSMTNYSITLGADSSDNVTKIVNALDYIYYLMAFYV